MASNMVIQKRSAMPENMKIATLNQEVIRRMVNTSEDLDVAERVKVVDEYAQKRVNSGYGVEQTRNIIIGGLKGYERKLKLSRDVTNPKWQPLHPPASYNIQGRRRKKILEKSNWFKKTSSLEEEEIQPEGRSVPNHSSQQEDHAGTGGRSQTSGTTRVQASNHLEEEVIQISSNLEDETIITEGDLEGVGDTSNEIHKKPLENTRNGTQKKNKIKNVQLDTKQNNNVIHPENPGGRNKPEGRKGYQKAKRQPDPETITVMFVEQTPGGVLAKRLQKVEDRLSKITGYRVRVTEMAGTQLCRILPNTNSWRGMDCQREDCYPCSQGGEELQDCKRRNILYENICQVCNPPGEE